MATSLPPFRSVLISSPGKVILHGEHAVVYGKSGIATSVNLRCYIFLHPTSSGFVSLRLPDMQLQMSWRMSEVTELLGSAEDEHLEVLRRFCNATDSPSMQSLACLILLYLLTQIVGEKLRALAGLEVFVSSQIPFGAGLGSSAAYSVCLATGLLIGSGGINIPENTNGVEETRRGGEIPSVLMDWINEKGISVDHSVFPSFSDNDLHLINKWGFEAEKLVHGTPSGIDNTISVFGGAIKFKSGIFTPMEKMPKLSILLVYTKVPRSTKKIVAGVRQNHTKYPQVTSPILDSIEAIVLKSEFTLEEIWDLTNQDDNEELQAKRKRLYTSLQELFAINHHLLNALGVGHSSLDKVHHIACENGLTAKLTGAGGGGCAVVLLTPDISHEHISEVKVQMESVGFNCWETSVGSRGVSLHCCI